MAEIRAFRGIRYDLGRVGTLADVVAPPYDVIDPDLQQRLYARSPYNVVRLELPREEPGDTDTNNRYTRAAATLFEWLGEDILVKDSTRCLYAYEQEFEIEGQRFRRRGFLARVRLEPLGAGQIFPHEETLSGPKADRLNLYRAVGMNVSPVFGLYPDETGEVFAPFEELLPRTLPLEAADDSGVVNRLWPVSDPGVIGRVTAAMGGRPVFIADGHHRYETSLHYLEEKRAAGEVPNDDAAPNFVLMMLVGMGDPGLRILPTHRLISGVPDLTADQLREALGSYFEVEAAGTGEQGARDAWGLIEADGTQALLGFGTAADGVWQTARLVRPEVMDEMAARHSPAWRELAVSVLHVLVLNYLLPKALGLSRVPSCRYVHRLDEAQEAVARRECPAAALVPPATMAHVEAIAGNREKMPPKSTYFYPKLLTGLVLNSLKGN